MGEVIKICIVDNLHDSYCSLEVKMRRGSAEVRELLFPLPKSFLGLPLDASLHNKAVPFLHPELQCNWNLRLFLSTASMNRKWWD